MPTIRLEQLSPPEIHRMLVSTIEPRPIAFVSTVTPEGTPNLAPFSFFTVASVNPPVLAFSCLQKPGGEPGRGEEKDTIRNVQETPECVVNVVSYGFAEPMSLASGEFPYGTDEFTVTGLTPVPSETVAPPRVGEAAAAYECRVERVVSWGEQGLGGNLVLARVLAIHLTDRVWKDGKIDQNELDPIGRLGGPFYVRVNEAVFRLDPPGPDEVRSALDAVSPSTLPR